MRHSFKLQDLLVSKDSSIKDCLRILDNGMRPTLFVVDGENKLLGTVTDGDIRRALLRGIGIEERAAIAMNAKPVVANETESRNARHARMRERDVNFLPVLDSAGHVTAIELLDDGSEVASLPFSAVLMCGGLGTRMCELTQHCPKPMLPIGDKPMLEKILRRLAKQGIKNFYFAINYLGNMIEDYFGDGTKFGVKIQYLREKIRLGTGGALSLITTKPMDAMLVMNGDIITDFDVQNIFSFHKLYNSFATMGIIEYQYQNQFGVVCHDGEKFICIKEKPVEKCHINSGIYVISPEFIDLIPYNTFIDMPDIFTIAKESNKNVTVFPIIETWSDIGRKDDYFKIQER